MLKAPDYTDGLALGRQYPVAPGYGCDEPKKRGQHTYNCTREQEHSGPHVAHIYRHGEAMAVLVWD